MAIEPRRLCSGHTNPASLEDAYRQHELVLDLAPPLLTISLLDCEALDVMFGFDFTYDGNHDEVVTEALGVGKALEGLLELPRTRVINFEPSLTLCLDESCQLQCRLAIETRTNAPQCGPTSTPTTRSACTSRSASTGAAVPTSRSSIRSSGSVRLARRSSADR